MKPLNMNYADKTNISLEEKALCFKNVFGEAPWNEGYVGKSGVCYPLSQKVFPEEVKEFWDTEELKKMWQERSEKKGFVEILAAALDGKLAGFTLGWETTIDTLNKDKLWLSEEEFAKLMNGLKTKLPDFPEWKFFYNADLALLPEYRGSGEASRLYKARVATVLGNGLDYALVRTTKKTDKPYKRYTEKLGYKEIYAYNDDQERVILAVDLKNQG